MKYVSINPMHDSVETAKECEEKYGAQTIRDIITQLRDVAEHTDGITYDTPVFLGDARFTCCCEYFCDIIVDCWDEEDEYDD